MHSSVRLVLCGVLAALGCSASLLAALSKNTHGSYDYNTASVPFLSESMKLMLSLVALSLQTDNLAVSFMSTDRVAAAKYMVLAALYTAQNNLLFVTLKHVEPASFQVFINLKIPVTAALLYLLADKRFSRNQVGALIMLVIGAVLSQADFDSIGEIGLSPTGSLLLASMVAISSTAGVVNEMLLKNNELGSVHWQNAQLYVFSTAFSFLKMRYASASNQSTMLAGYNIFTCLSILNMAFLGLVTSAVLKHADNILRAFASVLSVFLAAGFAWLLLGSQLTAAFFLGASITCAAVFVYTTM
jgi:UDP-sugar transporter A1/2/3